MMLPIIPIKIDGKIVASFDIGGYTTIKYVDKIILTFFLISGILYLPIFIGGDGKQ